MHGLTEGTAPELAPLAKSWLRPPSLDLKGAGYTVGGYEQAERAYMIARANSGNPGPLTFKIAATREHPIVNPAFIIKGWGDADATLKLNGKEIDRGKEFRFGHRRNPEGSDLIVWIKIESDRPITMTFTPTGN